MHTSLPLPALHSSPFLWNAIHDSIDANTGNYQPGSAAVKAFESLTGLGWQDSPLQPKIECINQKCTYLHDVEWTTFGTDLRATAKTANRSASLGTGFADPGFIATCPACRVVINHEALRVSKFKKDAGIVNNTVKTFPDDASARPMPGTILGEDGLFIDWSATSDTVATDSYANLVVAAMLRRDLNAVLQCHDMETLRKLLDATMQDRNYIRPIIKALHGKSYKAATRQDRASIRSMMSRYWDNSSMFSLDLVGAVIRQGTFVQKMVDLDWLNSPAVSATAGRLITKYTRFLHLMSTFKGMLLVPTLDVDLAWHTHQLSSSGYRNHTISTCGKFIDHDDKIPKDKLSDSFAHTIRLYEMTFNEAYSECLCWYCEAIRASHAPTKGIFKKTLLTSEAESQLYAHAAEMGISDDPSKGCHISTHNAIRSNPAARYMTQKAQQKMEKDFEKAVKRAIKDGRKPPEKRGDDSASAYGYAGAFYPFPMPMAYGYGYAGAPLYVAAPACAIGSGGAAGNCCAGTCGVGGAACAGVVGGGACGAGGGGAACGGGGGGGGCGGGGGGGC